MAINQQDGATLRTFACTSAQSSVSDYVNLVLRYQVHASLKGSPTMDEGNGQTTDYISYWLSQNNASRRQRQLRKRCGRDVEIGVTAPSPGQMRPAWPHRRR